MVKRIEPLPETLPIFDTEYLDHKLIQDLWQIFIAFRQDPDRSSKIHLFPIACLRFLAFSRREMQSLRIFFHHLLTDKTPTESSVKLPVQ